MDKVMASRGRVLLVEDHPVNREVAVAMLERMGCEVVAANGGVAALGLWAGQAFDLVLMDIQMPDMDGIETTRRIRELERQQSRPPVPIVALTANTLGEDRAAALAAGMNDYLLKPMTYGALLGRVSRWVPGQEAGGEQGRASAPDGAEGVDLAAIGRLPGVQGALASPKAKVFVSLFLDETRRQLDLLATALAAGDGGAVGRQCHRLKSAAATMGALDLARLARELESACRAGTLEPGGGAYSRQMERALRCYHETVRVAGVVVPPPLDS